MQTQTHLDGIEPGEAEFGVAISQIGPHALRIDVALPGDLDAFAMVEAIKEACQGGGVRITLGGDAGFGVEGYEPVQ